MAVRNKGDAMRTILAEMDADAPVAYLGDDQSDEDAFRALQGRGLACSCDRSGGKPRPTSGSARLPSSWHSSASGGTHVEERRPAPGTRNGP